MQTAKRRRLDLAGAEYVSSMSGNPSSGDRHGHQQYLPALQTHNGDDDNVPAVSSDFTLRSRSTVASHDRRAASAHFPSWDASSYPDAATSSQQPYFYASQTDPSTYNSPWPPIQTQVGALEDRNGNNYAGNRGTTVVPYFDPSDAGMMNVAGDLDQSLGSQLQSMQHYDDDVEMSGEYPYDQEGNASAPPKAVQPEESSAMVFDDASMHLKNQSLPILDNLASQLIQTISKLSLLQIQEILSGVDSEEGQAYNTLKSLFEQTRKVYSRDSPFIDAIAIQMFQSNQQEIIRKANIATFISSILGAHDVSFFHLNEFFMETFVPLGNRLLKWQGAIYLELKTQAYISALINSDGHPAAMLDELFPPDLDAQILTRHPDAPSLSPSEQDFVDRSKARKHYLLAEGNADVALKELPKKYQWTDFAREFASCISKNVDAIMNVPVRTQTVQSALERKANSVSDNTHSLALLSSATALSNVHIPKDGDGTSKKSSAVVTAPSAGPSSTVRQPWTKPEEDALLSGLERVNGPHWSQILALFGRGGSVSEVLKDRNQVQLKDKARNLKLWHLKMGKEVPHALKGVTGELRKRGGKSARAAAGEEDAEGGDDDIGQVSTGGSRRKKTKKGS